MKVRVVVDHDLCEANAICMKLVPEVFYVGDDDHLVLLAERVDGELLERVRLAEGRCPKRAITAIADEAPATGT